MARDLRLLTFNVLLPNSVRGWWISKMYRPEVPLELRAWPHRQRRLAEILLGRSPDVICLQEMCPDSFESDVHFLREAGYEALLHRKFELRVATFWRRDPSLHLVLQGARHMDRVLVTTFGGDRPLHVINCHLTAGPHPDRRLRQVHEALERLEPGGELVICGDFNSPLRSALHELLERGEVGPSFRDELQPDRPVTSRVRRHARGPLRDVYAEAYAGSPPPSYVAAWYRWMYAPGGGPSEALLAALQQLYMLFLPWGQESIERWLRTINGASDRGREPREVERLLAGQQPRTLSLPQLVEIYRGSLEQGAPWAIDHDLRACGLSPPPPAHPPFEARLDYLFCSAGLEVLAVQEPWSAELREAVRARGEILPNAEHPSDHLPLEATFRWR
jgi:endonuclease/exonuclease/phosphatase family metal-dependent hydrolase